MSSPPSTASTSTSSGASRSASSGPTARASRPRCGCSARRCSAPPASCPSSATIRRPTAPSSASHLGVVPQQDNLDTELTVAENIHTYGRYFGLPRDYLRGRVDELLGVRAARGQARRQGRRPQRRHEAPADHRPRARQRADHPAARRAHHRPRPAGTAHPLGPAVPVEGDGRHPRHHHALHGRGRAAVRPAGGDGPGPHRRGGLPRRADPPLLRPARSSRCASARTGTPTSPRGSTTSASAARSCPTASSIYTDAGEADLERIVARGFLPVTSLVRRVLARGRVPAPDRPQPGGRVSTITARRRPRPPLGRLARDRVPVPQHVEVAQLHPRLRHRAPRPVPRLDRARRRAARGRVVRRRGRRALPGVPRSGAAGHGRAPGRRGRDDVPDARRLHLEQAVLLDASHVADRSADRRRGADRRGRSRALHHHRLLAGARRVRCGRVDDGSCRCSPSACWPG